VAGRRFRQFTDTSEVVDMQSVDDQMRVFDRLTGVALIDIKAGLFTDVLDSLGKTGLLDDVRAGRFNLALLHVLGPSASSLSEVAAISQKLGAGSSHLLVKNYINESGKEWGSDPRFAGFLNSQSRVVTTPISKPAPAPRCSGRPRRSAPSSNNPTRGFWSAMCGPGCARRSAPSRPPGCRT
jgi:hypothetical protein